MHDRWAGVHEIGQGYLTILVSVHPQSRGPLPIRNPVQRGQGHYVSPSFQGHLQRRGESSLVKRITLEVGLMIKEGERSRSRVRALGAVTST